MTPLRFVVILGIMMTIFIMPAFAGGFQLNEHGARAMAQGGAFAARATDGSAMYFNPAGLGFQTQGSVLIGTTVIMPTSSFYGPLEDNSNTKYSQKSLVFTPVNGYVVYPALERFTFGVSVNNQFGLGTEYDAEESALGKQMGWFFYSIASVSGSRRSWHPDSGLAVVAGRAPGGVAPTPGRLRPRQDKNARPAASVGLALCAGLHCTIEALLCSLVPPFFCVGYGRASPRWQARHGRSSLCVQPPPTLEASPRSRRVARLVP